MDTSYVETNVTRAKWSSLLYILRVLNSADKAKGVIKRAKVVQDSSEELQAETNSTSYVRIALLIKHSLKPNFSRCLRLLTPAIV